MSRFFAHGPERLCARRGRNSRQRTALSEPTSPCGGRQNVTCIPPSAPRTSHRALRPRMSHLTSYGHPWNDSQGRSSTVGSGPHSGNGAGGGGPPEKRKLSKKTGSVRSTMPLSSASALFAQGGASPPPKRRSRTNTASVTFLSPSSPRPAGVSISVRRGRRARGPPPQTEIFSTVLDEEFSQIPPEGEEDLNQANQDLLGGDEPL